MNKKLYIINGNTFGIDFDSVLCFYIQPGMDKDVFDKYSCEYGSIMTTYFEDKLCILIGNKFSSTIKETFVYAQYQHSPGNTLFKEFNKTINNDIHQLYEDLIKYFTN